MSEADDADLAREIECGTVRAPIQYRFAPVHASVASVGVSDSDLALLELLVNRALAAAFNRAEQEAA